MYFSFILIDFFFVLFLMHPIDPWDYIFAFNLPYFYHLNLTYRYHQLPHQFPPLRF